MATISLNKFVKHPDGRCEFVFTINGDGGQGRTYSSIDDVVLDIRGLEGDQDNLVRFLIAYWKSRSADFSNTAIILNKTLTVDFSAANPIRLQ